MQTLAVFRDCISGCVLGTVVLLLEPCYIALRQGLMCCSGLRLNVPTIVIEEVCCSTCCWITFVARLELGHT